MAKRDFEGLARRSSTGLREFVESSGIAGPVRTEAGARILDVDAAKVAHYSSRVAVNSMYVGFGAAVLDTVGSTSTFLGVNEVAVAGLLGGVGTSLVLSAPATPRHESNVLRLRSQNLRRSMIGGSAVVAADNALAMMGGAGSHHTSVGVAALAVGAAGYLGGL